MSLTFLELEIGNPANPSVTEKLEFLMLSGAIYSVVPTSTLERLEIWPITAQEFILANGTKIVCAKKAVALFKEGERIGRADVVFGEDGNSVLLGAFTLEAPHLVRDLLYREFKPLAMVLARSSAERS